MKIKVRDKVGLKKCDVGCLYQTVVDTGYKNNRRVGTHISRHVCYERGGCILCIAIISK